MNYFTLNNNATIPAIGSGTNSFGKEGGFAGTYTGSTAEVVSCIKAGYRLFDTAESYGNEEVVAKGIKESGLPREEFFIETKMKIRSRGVEPAPVMGTKEAEAAIARSLKQLGTDYIDIYLIHHPTNTLQELKDVWSVFEEYYDKGILKTIGVCNFTVKELEQLLSFCRIKPALNQIKLNPECVDKETVEFCQENEIRPMAWSPLNFSQGREELSLLAEKYGVSWSQLLLNYNWRKGIISIPKSHFFAHQVENIDVFKFDITDEDMSAISKFYI